MHYWFVKMICQGTWTGQEYCEAEITVVARSEICLEDGPGLIVADQFITGRILPLKSRVTMGNEMMGDGI